MPHESINQEIGPAGQARIRSANCYNWNNPAVPWATYGDLNQYKWLSMPATVHNPVRSDGSRAPSAFWTRRVFVELPAVSGSAKPYPTPCGSPGDNFPVFKEATAIPRAGLIVGLRKQDYITVFCHGSFTKATVDSIARTNFLNKLASASGKDQVQLGVALGEVRETAGMITDLSRRAYRGVTTVAKKTSQSGQIVARYLDIVSRHGIRSSVARAARTNVRRPDYVLDAWLTYQLGLRPLAMDVYDSMVWLRAAQVDSADSFQVKVKSGHELSEELFHELHRPSLNDAYYYIIGKFKTTTAYHYSAVYKVPVQATIPEQLGLWNPASVAWNLVRYTWLVDYVSNTGAWLNSMLAAQNTAFVEGSRSLIQRASLLESEFREVRRPWISEPRLEGIIQVENFERTVLTSGVMPALIPAMKNRLDLTRMANAIAVLVKLAAGR